MVKHQRRYFVLAFRPDAQQFPRKLGLKKNIEKITTTVFLGNTFVSPIIIILTIRNL